MPFRKKYLIIPVYLKVASVDVMLPEDPNARNCKVVVAYCLPLEDGTCLCVTG